MFIFTCSPSTLIDLRRSLGFLGHISFVNYWATCSMKDLSLKNNVQKNCEWHLTSFFILQTHHTHTNTNIHTQLKDTLEQGERDREGEREFNLFKDSWEMLVIYNIFIFGKSILYFNYLLDIGWSENCSFGF